MPNQSQHKNDLKNKRADCANVSILLNNVFFSNGTVVLWVDTCCKEIFDISHGFTVCPLK